LGLTHSKNNIDKKKLGTSSIFELGEDVFVPCSFIIGIMKFDM
jgi:hypothetical protein